MTTQSTDITTSDYLLSTSRDYAIYICENRAIPKIQDGLKDSQRKALWVLKGKSGKIKTISLAGEMISENLYLHGDAAAADAISQLAAPYNNNTTLIEGIGTFGTRIAPIDGISAPRYTYVKSSNITEKLVYVDSDIIPLKDNYDGSTKEPVHFLPLVPLVLLNGVNGIAIGWATKIFPRSLKTIINACQAAIKGKKLPDLTPQFTYLNNDIETLPDGSFKAYGKLTITSHNSISITELPYGVTIESFRSKLNKMEEDGLIQSYKDNSAKTIQIDVKFKRSALVDWSEQQAIEFFELHSKYRENIVAVDWDGASIRKFDSAEQIINEFVQWRVGKYYDRFTKRFNDDDYECKYWLAVKACFDKKISTKVQKSKTKAEVIDLITKASVGIGADEEQISKISSLPLYRWTEDEYVKVCDNIDKLIASMQEYRDILADENKIKDLYYTELTELLKLCK